MEERVTISTRTGGEKENYFVVPIFAPPAIRLRNSICPGKSMEKTSILKRLGTVESFIESLPKCYLTLSRGKHYHFFSINVVLGYQALPKNSKGICIFFFLFSLCSLAMRVCVYPSCLTRVALKRYSFVNAGRHVQSWKEQSSYA